MGLVDVSLCPQTISRIQTSDGELVLRAYEMGRGEPPAYEVIFNGTFLTSTRNHSSERQLARIALRLVHPVDGLHVLIGGLGIGYTLAEALSDPRVIRSDVVEISGQALASMQIRNRDVSTVSNRMMRRFPMVVPDAISDNVSPRKVSMVNDFTRWPRAMYS